ncbi:MAG: hypothetical protein ABEI86_06675, partial [Halobacteriaceae archaeon]
AVIFALEATAVTPLSASTANQHIETQQRKQAIGLLVAAEAEGVLKRAVLDWNVSETRFRGSGNNEVSVRGGPPNTFGQYLNHTFDDEGVAFNVYFRYRTASGDQREIQVVDMGNPSDNAVVATRTVILYDDDEVVGSNRNLTA